MVEELRAEEGSHRAKFGAEFHTGRIRLDDIGLGPDDVVLDDRPSLRMGGPDLCSPPNRVGSIRIPQATPVGARVLHRMRV